MQSIKILSKHLGDHKPHVGGTQVVFRPVGTQVEAALLQILVDRLQNSS
jgi:hypothetical protein